MTTVDETATSEIDVISPEPVNAEQPDVVSESLPLSKNKLRKLRQQERWEEKKAMMKTLRKDKKKRDQLARAQAIEAGEPVPTLPRSTKRTVPADQTIDGDIVVDLGFDDKMTEKEIKSLSTQLSHCYCTNRFAKNAARFSMTSFGGQFKERMETAVDGYKNWTNVNFETRDYLELFADRKQDLIYLTADSPNVLITLETDKIYIIGGLVDKNRYKGICHEKALAQGIQTGQLPISQHIQLDTRKVLTVNHVYEILIKYRELQNWKDALLAVIPPRKIAGSGTSRKSKRQRSESGESESELGSDGEISAAETRSKLETDGNPAVETVSKRDSVVPE